MAFTATTKARVPNDVSAIEDFDICGLFSWLSGLLPVECGMKFEQVGKFGGNGVIWW